MNKKYYIHTLFSHIVWLVFVFTFVFLLSGCAELSETPASVMDEWGHMTSHNGFYTVQKGDTLYSIAWEFGLDFKELAKLNRLSKPYMILPGQRLIVKPPKLHLSNHNKLKGHSGNTLSVTADIPEPNSIIKQTSIKTNSAHDFRIIPTYSALPVKHWRWPAEGKLASRFTNALIGNKGIDIRGTYGEKIFAAAAGRVVYSGSGLRGYGNLIIIKHNDAYLSAYAFNEQILVKDDEWVQSGQTIALMGHNLSGDVMLHFEIRRNGQPVDPLKYLPKLHRV